MRRKLLTALLTLVCSGAFAIETVPIKGSIISPTDQFIQYTGRISFANPERPAWNFPGIQIIASFEGTSLRMIAKPRWLRSIRQNLSRWLSVGSATLW